MLLEKLLSAEVTPVLSYCKEGEGLPREQRDTTDGVMAAHYLLQKSSSLFMFNLNLFVATYVAWQLFPAATSAQELCSVDTALSLA